MKRKLWYILLVAVLAVVMTVSMTVGALADDEDPGIQVVKEVNVLDDGTYTVDLEAFATGTVEFSEETVPVDLILVLDVSGSMAENINTYSYTARNSQAYSYDGYGNNTYYYQHTNGNYYPVVRERTGYTGNRRYNLHYTVGSTTYYLSGTGVTTTNPSVQGSGSTIWTGVLYTRRTVSSQTKLSALQTAVNNFIDVVAEKNQEILDKDSNAPDKELSRVSIVKLAYNRAETNYADYVPANTTYAQGNTRYNYTQVFKDLTVVREADLNTANTGWHASVNALTASGATSADYAMGYANAVYNKNHTGDFAERDTVIVMFTDGEPNHQSGFDNAVARDTVNTSKTLKDKGVKVFTVAVYDDANPADDPGEVNINQYLHAVSSNYKTATAANSGWTITWGARTMKADGVTKDDYYFAASSAEELDKIFTAIAQSSAGTTSQVGAQSVMKDIVSSSFTLPEGADISTIQVSIVPWDSTTHDWSTSVKYTTDQWKTECMNYLRPEVTEHEQENVAVTISEDGKTIDITGFDYATHFQATNHADEDHDGANVQTAKIVVTFPIQARPSAVTGGNVATNGSASGIYLTADSETAIIYFPVPEVKFTPVTYVVDYVTSDTSTDTKASTVKLDYSSVLDDVQMLDDPSDDYLIGEEAVDFEYTIYKGKYGTISFGDDEVDVQRRYVRYAPTTMDWDGYDRIFIKGKSATESNMDVWAMLAVLPANSVFYEDTYITQTKTVEYAGETITIEYTGISYGEGQWTTVGTEGKNQTYHAGDEMGWIEGLEDDYEYANDMAHTTGTKKATATFTFSGTGVDIYSRTNGATGTVMVQVRSHEKNENGKYPVNKAKIIDTKAAAGDFFAIPVCTFTNLAYGKYDVIITVTTGAQAEGRMTFYLDGVRVYNPIQPLEGDGNVEQMYGAKNLGAVFTEVRSLLGTGATASALYIDEHTTSEIVSDVEAIEEAAKALSEAQAARDAYVESTITPAKNAVSAAEYALSSAKAAAESAGNVYEVAKAAADANPDDANLQAAAAAALAKKEAAEDALVEAQATYDAQMPGLLETLNAAIAGRAELDATVEAKRTAYDDVNDGVELKYSTTEVAEYNKEGPKSEVLLSPGEQVLINVEPGKTYYVGLRSLKGDAVTVQINGQTVTYVRHKGTANEETVSEISHTVDMYYEAVPDNGKIVIKNASAADSNRILSVTKLRTTGTGNTVSGVKTASTAEMLAFVRKLATTVATNYTGDVLTGDEVADEIVPTEPEVTETTIGEEDITIENAEAEPEAAEPEAEPAEEVAEPTVSSTLAKLLKSFFRFYRP